MLDKLGELKDKSDKVDKIMEDIGCFDRPMVSCFSFMTLVMSWVGWVS